MKSHHRLKLGIGLLFSVIGLGLILTMTTPDNLPLAILLLVFLLIYMTLAIAIYIILYSVRFIGGFSWSRRQLKRHAAGVAAVPVFLIILQSIGQLTFQDVLLTAGVSFLAYFYYRRVRGVASSTS